MDHRLQEIADRVDTTFDEVLELLHREVTVALKSKTERRIFDSDLQVLGRGARLQPARHEFVGSVRRRPDRYQRKIVEGRDFPRESDHAQAVGTIGGDFEIDDGVIVAERLNRGELEAAQAEPFTDLFGRRLDVDEITQPRNE